MAACGQHNDIVTPTAKPLIEAAYASGFVVAEDEYEVFAQVDGRSNKKNFYSNGDFEKRMSKPQCPVPDAQCLKYDVVL